MLEFNRVFLVEIRIMSDETKMFAQKELLVIRILFYPITLLQFCLVVMGWHSLWPLVESKLQDSMKETTWTKIGCLWGVLFIVYPFYLKISDMPRKVTRDQGRSKT